MIPKFAKLDELELVNADKAPLFQAYKTRLLVRARSIGATEFCQKLLIFWGELVKVHVFYLWRYFGDDLSLR